MFLVTFIQINLFTIYVNCAVIDQYGPEIEASAKLANCLSGLINSYKEYDVYFHFDQINLYVMDELIKKLSIQELASAIIIKNHDCYIHSCKQNSFKSKNGKQVVHVIALDYSQDFYLEMKNTRKDVAIFIVQNNNIIQHIVMKSNLNVFENVLIINHDFEIFKVRHFCRSSSNEDILYLVGNNSSKIKIQTQLQVDTLNDSRQTTFKVTFINYYPLIWCAKTGKDIIINCKEYKVCEDVKGTDFKIIEMLAHKLNFTILPIVSTYGYKELINETGQGFFDVAMGGITVTAPRSELATFTTIYWYEGYHCLFFLGDRQGWFKMFSFLQPLQKSLWLAYIVSCVLIVFVLFLIGKCWIYSLPYMSVRRILWICVYFIVDQQVPLRTLSKLQRRSCFLLCVWCLVCLNINTAYKSKLLSTLLNPLRKEPQTILSLAAEDYVFVTNSNYDDVITAFLNSGHFKGKQNLLKLKDTVCDEFEYAAAHRAAVIDEYTSIQYEVRNTCHRVLNKYKEQLEYVRITQPIRMFGHAWALRKRAPYEDDFNRIIYRIISIGLILKWRQDATRELDNNAAVFGYSRIHGVVNKVNTHVTVDNLISPFFVYIMGNVFALATFIGELIKYKIG